MDGLSMIDPIEKLLAEACAIASKEFQKP